MKLPQLPKTKIKNKKIIYSIILATIGIGIALRFYVMTLGHNFDFESYKIVGEIVSRGGNVYAETTRYNYGPVWFTLLGFFHFIASLFTIDHDTLFRILIVGFLTVVDIAIALLLRKKFGLLAFVIFFLNPISIIITGFHNQFDNLAVLVGLTGLMIMPPIGSSRITKSHLYASLVIGLSLMIKHIFFMLPLWLFVREKELKVKLFIFFLPLAIFVLGFLPFVFAGFDGILHNVFLYKSFANAPLINSIFSPGLLVLINPMLLLIGVLVVVGFMTRRLPVLEAGMWYLLVLVVFSPAIANQYLAIIMPAIAVLGFVFFIPYIVLCTLLLAIASISGIHLTRFADNVPQTLLAYVDDSANGDYKLIILMLFVGLVLAAVYRYRRHWYINTVNRVLNTLFEQWVDIDKTLHLSRQLKKVRIKR